MNIHDKIFESRFKTDENYSLEDIVCKYIDCDIYAMVEHLIDSYKVYISVRDIGVTLSKKDVYIAYILRSSFGYINPIPIPTDLNLKIEIIKRNYKIEKLLDV